jgi:hypothetical protein
VTRIISEYDAYLEQLHQEQLHLERANQSFISEVDLAPGSQKGVNQKRYGTRAAV